MSGEGSIPVTREAVLELALRYELRGRMSRDEFMQEKGEAYCFERVMALAARELASKAARAEEMSDV